jgi:hypothetical protein
MLLFFELLSLSRLVTLESFVKSISEGLMQCFRKRFRGTSLGAQREMVKEKNKNFAMWRNFQIFLGAPLGFLSGILQY